MKLEIGLAVHCVPNIPKSRNNNGIDRPDTAAADIDSSNTNLSHDVAYVKILCYR